MDRLGSIKLGIEKMAPSLHRLAPSSRTAYPRRIEIVSFADLAMNYTDQRTVMDWAFGSRYLPTVNQQLPT